MPAGALNPAARRRALEAATSGDLDLLVVGGGITGVGTALDAATRGLSVALVEARDLASGTSSASSKLFHGGLRYLEMGDLGLVREALRERELMLTRLAPHLVRPVPFLWPLRGRGWERAYLGAGLALYDTIGGARSVPRHRHLSRRGALTEAPALRDDALVGAVQFHDVASDDARMVVAVARTAAAHGAHIATRVRVTGMGADPTTFSAPPRAGARSAPPPAGALSAPPRAGAPSEAGQAVIQAIDEETGEPLALRARHVALAAGPWTDAVRSLAGAGSTHRIVPSKGIHIFVAGDRIPMRTGVLARTEKSVLFIIPWRDGWLIGDTDTAWRLGPDRPVATGADVDYLLAKTNALLAEPLTRADVHGVTAGLRPLVAPADRSDTTRISRRHRIETPLPWLTTIAGGKLTTYRIMAADLVDTVQRALGRRRPSVTRDVPLIDAREELAALVAASPELAEAVTGSPPLGGPPAGAATGSPPLGEPPAGAATGSPPLREPPVGAATGSPPLREPPAGAATGSPPLGEPPAGAVTGVPPLGEPLAGSARRADVVLACTHEGALHLDDVLERRTRLALTAPDRGLSAAAATAELMAGALGWSREQTRAEVDAWRARVEAARAAETERDDAAALRAATAERTPA